VRPGRCSTWRDVDASRGGLCWSVNSQCQGQCNSNTGGVAQAPRAQRSVLSAGIWNVAYAPEVGHLRRERLREQEGCEQARPRAVEAVRILPHRQGVELVPEELDIVRRADGREEAVRREQRVAAVDALVVDRPDTSIQRYDGAVDARRRLEPEQTRTNTNAWCLWLMVKGKRFGDRTKAKGKRDS
jgi:hypothetical protein